MSIELGLLIGAIGCIIGVLTFFAGRKSASKAEGEEWGTLKADIRHIKDDMNEIKATVSRSSEEMATSLLRESEQRREAVKRLHDRMDEHVQVYHKNA